MRWPPTSDGRSTTSRQGSDDEGALTSRLPPDEQALDRLVDGAPLVFVRLVATQEVHPSDARSEGAADVRIDHQDAGGELARIGVDTGIEVEEAVGDHEMDAGGDPP